MPRPKHRVCIWVPLHDAGIEFAKAIGGTESAEHIVKMHWYVAGRLVVEGGFHPDHVKPHPPLKVERKRNRNVLVFDPAVATGSEATVFGGLKTKHVDVSVTIPELGPCVAVSMKGSLNAFRNLTNRLEEAVGDCTNVHIAYPAMVYGFMHLIRANREGPIPASATRFLKPHPKTGLMQAADVAIRKDGQQTDFLQKYHLAMARLSGRKDLRNDYSRYEAVALVFIEGDDKGLGTLLKDYPDSTSSLRFERFFETIYRDYDLRFVYGAPDLRRQTRRLEWAASSPALREMKVSGFEPRIAAESQ